MKVFVDSAKKLRDSILDIRSSNLLGVDTETSGLDPHTAKLWSIQISTEAGNDYLFTIDGITLELVPLGKSKSLLLGGRGFLGWIGSDQVKIFHNGSFDLKILKAQGLTIKNSWCTLIAEKVLTAGKFERADLGSTLNRRLGVALDKSTVKDFYDGSFQADLDAGKNPWTQARIDYCLNDISYLLPLYEKQKKLAQAEGLGAIGLLEQDLVPVVAGMEYRGIKLDKKKCKVFHEDMKTKAAEIKESLTSQLESFWQSYWRPVHKTNTELWLAWRKEYVKVQEENKERVGRKLSDGAKAARQAYKSSQPFASAPKEKGPINLNSPSQVLPTFSKAGIILPDTKKDTLNDYVGQHPLLDEYLDYRQFTKLGQFGSLYEEINPVTGRVHSSFNQIVDTGRIASSRPNLQNIPTRSKEGKDFKRLFIPERGKKFIIADYSAIELVIAAVMSEEQLLIDAINKDLDLHCNTLALMLDEDYEGIVTLKKGDEWQDSPRLRRKFQQRFTLPELEKIDSDVEWLGLLRSLYIKTMTYGVVYGLSPFGMSRKFHCEVEDANKFIYGFFGVYKDLKSWLDKTGIQGLTQGYSTTLTGRKRYYSPPKPVSSSYIASLVHKELERQERIKDSVSHKEWNKFYADAKELAEREYKQKVSAIKRKASNAPVQGTGSDITKLAMVQLEDEYRAKSYPDNEGVILSVHDEIISEVSKARAGEAAGLTKAAMEEAANEILGSGIKITVEVKVTDNWDKG